MENNKIFLSEIDEFVEVGKSFLQDSLWFEAQISFDSALSYLTQVEALDSLDSLSYVMLQKYREEIYSMLIRAISHSSHLQIAYTWTQLWDQEIEKVSDSKIDSIKELSTGFQIQTFGLPITPPLNSRILSAMAVLTGPGRPYFQKWLNRKGKYQPIIEKKLRANGLPKELIYLAMVESGFSPWAWSQAQACGIWQFISETGKRYGLEINWWIDERRDPEKATDAAIQYLKKLFQYFGNWNMAMAGYNCGEGRIWRQLKKDSTLSFWDMELPKETMKYVPKILAAMIIGENPKQFGFTIVPEEPVPYDTITVQHCLSLSTIAKMLKVDDMDVKHLNPELRRWCTPPETKSYVLKIPLHTRGLFVKKYAVMDKNNLISWHRHKVSSGETLGHLAERYGVPVRAIKHTNNLRGNLIRIGQSLIIPIPSSKNTSFSNITNPQPVNRPRRTSPSTPLNYTVKSGDNLFDIARKYGTSVTGIMQLNGLSYKSIIRPGQKLKLLPSKKSGTVTATSAADESADNFRSYKVRKGDNLIGISNKLGVTVTQLKKWNRLKGSRIKAGQILRYKVSGSSLSSRVVYYIVKKNDNLWDISRKFKTSVESIKQLNNHLPKLLKPGMKIRVK
ncbi:MAG: LysM peptidoglycan-binding domain-containing protein [Fibrobacteria bacterium]|nr:LysM peptidoglycan-binding domain-containing protein [Fibrobacteria bacterium]